MSEPRSAADEVRAALYGTDALALFEQILTGESGSDVSATKGAPSPPSPRLPQSHGYWNDAEKRWVFPLHPIDPDQPAVLLRDTPEDVERLWKAALGVVQDRRIQIIENDAEGMGRLVWVDEFIRAIIERLRHD